MIDTGGIGESRWHKSCATAFITVSRFIVNWLNSWYQRRASCNLSGFVSFYSQCFFVRCFPFSVFVWLVLSAACESIYHRRFDRDPKLWNKSFVPDKKKAHSLRLHKENETREKEKMSQARKMDTGSSQSSHSHGSGGSGSSRSSRSSGSSRSSRISRTSGKSSRISNNSRCLLWWMRIKLAQSLRVDVLSSFLGADATTDTKLPISEMYQLNLSRRCFSARFRISRDELPPSKQTTNQN